MNLEHLLTEEQLQLRQTMRDFTKREIIPIAKELESDYSLVEKVHQKLVDIGIQAMQYPVEYGGGGSHSSTSKAIIAEELSKGDAGIALSVCSNMGAVGPAASVGNKAVLDRFAPLYCQGKLAYACLSMTDEAGGADTENPLLHGAGMKTIAKLEGDEYVINGNKMWPTHGGIAECYITICTTDPNLGDDGIAVILVPKDAPGLSFGKPEKKMLFRTVVNGAVYYDNVLVPKEYRMAGPGMDANFFYTLTAVAGWSSGLQALGIAERASGTLVRRIVQVDDDAEGAGHHGTDVGVPASKLIVLVVGGRASRSGADPDHETVVRKVRNLNPVGSVPLDRPDQHFCIGADVVPAGGQVVLVGRAD